MNGSSKLGGAVVPLVTPRTSDGQLDFAALDRLIETQIAGGIEGILILGTTGEGPSVPLAMRLPLVEHAVKTASGRILVYANVAENCLDDAIAAGKAFLAAGATAIAALPPSYYPPNADELSAWFRALLDAMPGPVVIYNIPPTTKVSIPLDVIGGLVDHPRLAGIKDSENDSARHTELLQRFGGRDDFSIFVGVGALMAQGLKQGADGIVPSVGNLIPKDCQDQVEAARRGDWDAVDALAVRQSEVAGAYQKGRSLGQSLAALKAMMHLRGLCDTPMFPPLMAVSGEDLESLGKELENLNIP